VLDDITLVIGFWEVFGSLGDRLQPTLVRCAIGMHTMKIF
jgi:hypothetical protein